MSPMVAQQQVAPYPPQQQQQQFVVQQTRSGNQSCHALCAVRRAIYGALAAFMCILNFALGNVPMALLMLLCSVLLFGYAAQNCNQAMKPDPVATTVVVQDLEQPGMLVPVPVQDPNMQRGYQPPALQQPGMMMQPAQQQQMPQMVVAATHVAEPQPLPQQPASLHDFLETSNLSHVATQIIGLGVHDVADFQDVLDEDLVGCSLKPIEIKRLRRNLPK